MLLWERYSKQICPIPLCPASLPHVPDVGSIGPAGRLPGHRQEGLADGHHRQRRQALGHCGQRLRGSRRALRAPADMAGACGAGEHRDVVAGEGNQVRHRDAELGSVPRVMGEARVRQADLVGLDLAIGYHRRGPRDLKDTDGHRHEHTHTHTHTQFIYFQ